MLSCGKTFSIHRDAPCSLAFIPGHEKLASGAHQWDDDKKDVIGVVKLWRYDGSICMVLRDLALNGQVAVSPDGKLLAAGCTDGSVQLHDIATKTLARTLAGQSEYALPRFSPDGEVLAVGGDSAPIVLYDTAEWKPTASLECEGAYRFALCPRGRHLAAGESEGEVRVWNLATLERRQFRQMSRAVCGIAFAPDGGPLVTACADKQLDAWDLGADFARGRFPEMKHCVRDLVFLPDGRLVTGDEAGWLLVWDAKARQCLFAAEAGAEVVALAADPAGARIVSAGPKGEVTFWEVKARAESAR